MGEQPMPPPAEPASPFIDGAGHSISGRADPPARRQPAFDPSRRYLVGKSTGPKPYNRRQFPVAIGIIRRKAMMKDLAAAYHAECLASCQELLELQKKWDEPYIELKPPEENRKEASRPTKRQKKSR